VPATAGIGRHHRRGVDATASAARPAAALRRETTPAGAKCRRPARLAGVTRGTGRDVRSAAPEHDLDLALRRCPAVAARECAQADRQPLQDRHRSLPGVRLRRRLLAGDFTAV
jgi:hypothetical protein